MEIEGEDAIGLGLARAFEQQRIVYFTPEVGTFQVNTADEAVRSHYPLDA
jgi:hypothetical protein